MTDQGPDHTAFDELAAGHAVHALEPADEQRFLRHASQCPRCRHSVADFQEVAAALAEIAPPAEPSKQLGERILAAAQADPDQQDRPAARPAQAGTAGANGEQQAAGAAARDGVTAAQGDATQSRGVPRRRRPSRHRPKRHRAGWRWQKFAAAAAAVALIAGGGIWAGLAATTSGPRSPLAACAHPHACAQVTLTAAATHRVAAKVIIYAGVAWMEPAKMATSPAGEIYVLWQITGAHTPLPVGSFDLKPGASAPIRIGGLAAPYSGTRAFEVSLEHGQTIPASPSKPVALGQVP